MASDYLGLQLSYYIEEENKLQSSSSINNINVENSFPFDRQIHTIKSIYLSRLFQLI